MQAKAEAAEGTHGAFSLHLASLIGGQPSGIPAVFSSDNKYFFVVFPYEIRVYFLLTRQKVRAIPIPGEQLVRVLVDSVNEDLLWLIYSTGAVSIVNWRDKELVSQARTQQLQFNLGVPVYSVLGFVDTEDQDRVDSSASGSAPGSGLGRPESLLLITADAATHKPDALVVHSLQAGDAAVWTSAPLLSCASRFHIAAYSHDLTKIAVLTGSLRHQNLEIHLVDRSGPGEPCVTTIPRQKHVCALAVSNSGVLAVGNDNGVVELIYSAVSPGSLGSSGSETPSIPGNTTRLLKWHVDGVNCLRFSLDGNYLLSGGKERVVVFWQLETDKTQFLPRLPGEICDISVDAFGEYYSVTVAPEGTECREVIVLSAVDLASRLNVTGLKAAFRKAPPTAADGRKKRKAASAPQDALCANDYTVNARLHPNQLHLYIPFGPFLQVFSVASNEQAYVHTVAPILQAGKVLAERKLQDPRVIHVEFSRDGQWMATVDETPGQVVDKLLSAGDKQYNLKFWRYSPPSGSSGASSTSGGSAVSPWVLVTRVVAPHGPAAVLDVSAAPDGSCRFLSVDSGSGMRVWEFAEASGAWVLRRAAAGVQAVSSAGSVCWAEDMSLVVRGCGTGLSVFTGKLGSLGPLACSVTSRIRAVRLLGRYLVVLSKTRLVVMNLATQKPQWSVSLNSSSNAQSMLTANETEFALAVNFYGKNSHLKSFIFVFSPNSLVPKRICLHKSGISWLGHTARGLCFIDFESRFGTLVGGFAAYDVAAAPVSSATAGEVSSGPEMQSLVDNAVLAELEESESEEDSNMEKPTRQLKLTDFDKPFESLETMSMEQMFARVMKIIG